MVDLIKPSDGAKYVDLTVGFEPEDDDADDLSGPPIRYHFGLWGAESTAMQRQEKQRYPKNNKQEMKHLPGRIWIVLYHHY